MVSSLKKYVGFGSRNAVNIKVLLSAIVPALFFAALSIYAFGYHAKPVGDEKALPGKPLAAYDEYYPIRANPNGLLYLDKERFEKAVEYFSGNASPRAAADLIYLGNSNHVELMLDEPVVNGCPNPHKSGDERCRGSLGDAGEDGGGLKVLRGRGRVGRSP
ncbi:MAG: hypothetical protein JNJ60_14565 [Rhodocyclaceae bacterium]|nr:hypothetical protein [Rhodocyclaceae bacterium]